MKAVAECRMLVRRRSPGTVVGSYFEMKPVFISGKEVLKRLPAS